VRARRASELAQQLVEDNRAAMEKALREILRDGTPGQKLKAIEALLKVGLSAERLDVAEHRDELQHRSREELIAMLADKLSGASMAGQLVRARMAEADVIDGHAVELPR
jgi:pseudouridine-5'-phosphate glycosidase